jgi:hypothetical protein
MINPGTAETWPAKKLINRVWITIELKEDIEKIV